MLSLDNLQTVLCLGAHADDIEIGCGGTLLSLFAARPQLSVHWVVLSGDEKRAAEAAGSCRAFCSEVNDMHFQCAAFRDSYFPYQGQAIKEYIHDLSARVQPDLIFTHRRDDAHQDHRLTSELTWNAFRGPAILEYEIPKWDGDLARPNVYVPLSEELAERKVALLLEHFPSQRAKCWFQPATFEAVLRLRGVESHQPWAEGFYSHKLLLTV